MKMIKIYYVPSRKITREYLLIKQGLESNPRIELVDNIMEDGSDYDFIFLFYTTLKHEPELAKVFPRNRLIFIDYHDKPEMVFDVKCLAYFKRSWVHPVASDLKEPYIRPAHFHPLTFAIMDEFIIDEVPERDYALTCTIRPHKRHPNRPRVLNFIKSLSIQDKAQIGQLNLGSMDKFNDWHMRNYFRLMKRSRIVVTCNPSRWEGDHRTWEAFASGALVFVDKMFTPMTHPLIDGKHCIFYEVSKKGLEELREKLIYYLGNIDKAREIANEGLLFTLNNHRASNRIDEILDIIT